MRSVRLAALGLCLLGVIGSVASAKVIKFSEDFFFPGVDEIGELSDEFGGEGTVNVRYNTRSGRLRVIGRASVENEFGKTRVYDDLGIIDDYISDGDVIKDQYRVSAGGSARYRAIVRNAEIDS
jgi:hypothetical protein